MHGGTVKFCRVLLGYSLASVNSDARE